MRQARGRCHICPPTAPIGARGALQVRRSGRGAGRRAWRAWHATSPAWGGQAHASQPARAPPLPLPAARGVFLHKPLHNAGRGYAWCGGGARQGQGLHGLAAPAAASSSPRVCCGDAGAGGGGGARGGGGGGQRGPLPPLRGAHRRQHAVLPHRRPGRGRGAGWGWAMQGRRRRRRAARAGPCHALTPVTPPTAQVQGTVVRVDQRGAHVDIGGKSTAFCPTSELALANIPKARAAAACACAPCRCLYRAAALGMAWASAHAVCGALWAHPLCMRLGWQRLCFTRGSVAPRRHGNTNERAWHLGLHCTGRKLRSV